jgi:hypothetical protein
MLQGLLEKFNSVNELGLLDLLSNKERENFIAKISPGACREMNGLKKFLSLFFVRPIEGSTDCLEEGIDSLGRIEIVRFKINIK